MLQANRSLPAGFWRKMLFEQATFHLGSSVAAWGMFLLRWLFGVDVLEWTGRDRSSPTFYFWIATGVTIVLIPWGLLAVNKACHLARYGVAIIGDVTTVSILGGQGLTPVRYTYTFKHYKGSGAIDLIDMEIKQMVSPERKIQLLVDPLAPEQSYPLLKVFPKGLPDVWAWEGSAMKCGDEHPAP